MCETQKDSSGRRGGGQPGNEEAETKGPGGGSCNASKERRVGPADGGQVGWAVGSLLETLRSRSNGIWSPWTGRGIASGEKNRGTEPLTCVG